MRLVANLQSCLLEAASVFDAQIHQLLPALRSYYSFTTPSQTVVALVVIVVVTELVSRVQQYIAERPVRIRLACPPQALPGWTSTILENPSISSPSKPGQIVCYDPATGYLIGHVEADTRQSILAKIERAKDAQRGWADSSFTLRRKVLKTMQMWVVDQAETIARVAARDTGKTAIDAAFGELLTTCSKLEWTIANGERVLQPETRPNNLLLAHKVCQVWHEPMGVVAACVSWNYSAHNAIGPIISSVFAGNAIVIKASELVAWSAVYFVNAVRQCLSASGADPELVQLVVCFPDAVESLTTHPDIAHITFIGSEEVGRKVAMAATKELTPVTLELGGKDPAILLKDTDVKYFNSTLMRSCFQGAGQNCIGIERFIVDEAIIDQLISMIEPRIRSIQMGSFMDDVRFGLSKSISASTSSNKLSSNKPNKPHSETVVDMGAMISDVRFSRIEQLIQDAVSRGAKLLVGGHRYIHPRWPTGHYFSPTLLTNVTSDMPIAQEELFAPIFLILPFPTLQHDQAITIANSTRYGLGSSIFGSNLNQCQTIAKQLKSGMVNINDFGVSYLNQSLPFGGIGKSGYGRFSGPEGLLSLTLPKSVTRDRFFNTVKTGIPTSLDYPLKSPHSSWSFVQGLIRFTYASDWLQRVYGLMDLIRNSF